MMAKQSVTLRVPIDETWDGGTRLQVYTNSGSGEIDFDSPLLARPVEVFPARPASRGLGGLPLGATRLGDEKPSRPHNAILAEEELGRTPLCGLEPFIDLVVDVPAVFGVWKFAVKAFDRFDNVQAEAGAEIERMVSGTEPVPLESFAVDNYDSETDQVTFAFVKQTE